MTCVPGSIREERAYPESKDRSSPSEHGSKNLVAALCIIIWPRLDLLQSAHGWFYFKTDFPRLYLVVFSVAYTLHVSY
jgi:hypothetical protein